MDAEIGEVYVSKKLLNKNNTVFIKILEENKAYAYHIIKTPLQFNIHYYLVGNLNDLRLDDFEKIENKTWKEIEKLCNSMESAICSKNKLSGNISKEVFRRESAPLGSCTKISKKNIIEDLILDIDELSISGTVDRKYRFFYRITTFYDRSPKASANYTKKFWYEMVRCYNVCAAVLNKLFE